MAGAKLFINSNEVKVNTLADAYDKIFEALGKVGLCYSAIQNKILSRDHTLGIYYHDNSISFEIQPL